MGSFAGANAYPWLLAADEGLGTRPLKAEQLTIAEAICRALTQVLAQEEDKKALAAAWDGGTPLARTLSVKTHAGEIEVTLRAPYESGEPGREASDASDAARTHGKDFDVLDELRELENDGEDIDAEARRELEDELVERFVASPEGKTITDEQACRFVMDFGANYFGKTIGTLDARELREIVFEIIPRKVSVEASSARWIIGESAICREGETSFWLKAALRRRSGRARCAARWLPSSRSSSRPRAGR